VPEAAEPPKLLSHQRCEGWAEDLDAPVAGPLFWGVDFRLFLECLHRLEKREEVAHYELNDSKEIHMKVINSNIKVKLMG
jgi:hypothetical protein